MAVICSENSGSLMKYSSQNMTFARAGSASSCSTRASKNARIALKPFFRLFAAGDPSSNRAIIVRNYLVQNGIADNRIQTRSYGEERPAAEGHDESAWALNRRAEFGIYDTTQKK